MILFLFWLLVLLPLGFIFSTEEPSALIQEQGGPCAIIASVQVNKFKLFTGWEVCTWNYCPWPVALGSIFKKQK